jgi:hypothetical protein
LITPSGESEWIGSTRIVREDVVRDDQPLRHDPDKLAQVLLRLYNEQRSSSK